jgi:outer membrane protein assembly factor BamD (BamD/ComL family)
MHPAIRAFWRAYWNGAGLDPAEASFLERCVKFAAARMIQTVYEHLYQSVQLTPSALALLQVSLNMLNRPSEARECLLGL